MATIFAAAFAQTPSPSFAVRESLASEFGATTRQVSIWFRNRRQRVRLSGQPGGPAPAPMRKPPKARTPQVPAKYLDGKLGQLALLKDLKHLRSAIEEASKPATAKPLERGMSQRDRILLKRGQSSTDYRI